MLYEHNDDVLNVINTLRRYVRWLTTYHSFTSRADGNA